MTLPVNIDLADLTDIYPLSIPAVAGEVLLQGGAVMLHGWSVQNPSTSASGLVEIYNGDAASGQLAAAIRVPVDGSDHEWMGVPGVFLDSALTINPHLDALTGALWVSRPAQ